MQYELTKIWRCIYPILLYTFIQQIIIILFGEDLFESHAVLLTALGALITIFIALYLRHGDFSKHHVVIFERSIRISSYVFIPILAVFCSTGLSFFSTLVTALLDHHSYEQVTATLFSEHVLIQIAGIGFIVPIAEEFIFRGLVQHRIRTYVNPKSAVIISGIVFGFFHDNIVQAVGAVISGLIISYLFELYTSLAAPVIFHICFNLTGIILQYMAFETPSYQILAGVGTISMTAAVITLILSKKAAER